MDKKQIITGIAIIGAGVIGYFILTGSRATTGPGGGGAGAGGKIPVIMPPSPTPTGTTGNGGNGGPVYNIDFGSPNLPMELFPGLPTFGQAFGGSKKQKKYGHPLGRSRDPIEKKAHRLMTSSAGWAKKDQASKDIGMQQHERKIASGGFRTPQETLNYLLIKAQKGG